MVLKPLNDVMSYFQFTFFAYIVLFISVPAFETIFDRLEDNIIEKVDSEIVEVINNQEGYVSGMFKFSLYINKKIS